MREGRSALPVGILSAWRASATLLTGKARSRKQS